jgi:hypothetical protein
MRPHLKREGKKKKKEKTKNEKSQAYRPTLKRLS